MRKSASYAAALAVFVLAFGALHSSASAASKVLTVTPATVKPTIDPGGSSAGHFQIINQGESDYSVHVYAAPYSIHDEDYNPDFTAAPGKPDVASWLHFVPAQSDIKQNQTVTVDNAVTVPVGTQPGGYYAVAFVETKAGTSGQGVVINERVGEIFYIQVAGPIKQAGKILSWSSPFWQKPPLSATLRLENDGGLHYASNVQVVVRDVFGRAKYSLATQKEVLPQTVRRIPVSWNSAPQFGLFKVTGSATVLGRTQALPTRYVLVVSPIVRYILSSIAAAVAAYGLGKYLVRRKWRSKQSASK